MRRPSLLLALLLAGCPESTPPPDAAPDGEAPVDLSFTADPDPAERTDCPAGPPSAGEVRAKRVVCAGELLEGALAMGRIGDFVIENARARFVIRAGAQSASTIGAPGGGLIDAAPQGDVDLLKEVFPLFDLASTEVQQIAVVDAGGGGEARVRVLFTSAPIGLLDAVLPGLGERTRLRGSVDYVLGPDEDALRIEIDLTTQEEVGQVSGRMGVLALMGGGERVQLGYGILDDDHLGGAGDAVILERPIGALALWLANDEATLTAVETVQLLRGGRSTVRRGELTRIEARVGVGSTAARALSAARVTDDPVLSLRGPAGDRVEIASADGTVWLRSRFDADGAIDVAAPAGSYDVTAGFERYFEGATTRVEHPASAGEPATIEASPSASFSVEATVDGASDVPVRVTIERDGEELERAVALGLTELRVPPGDFRVTVSHGLEYDVFTLDLSLGAGASAALTPALPRVLDTDGWVSVDLHLHSDLSTDSVHPIEDAARLLWAEGVQAASATDHDYVTDYTAIAEGAGVRGLVLVSGVEVSTTTFGHINGYPLTRRPELAGAGAPVWFDMGPADVFGALRGLGDEGLGGAIVQVNHPRFGDASFFGAVRLDATTGRVTRDPVSGMTVDGDLSDFGFEVVEIFNGCCRSGDEAAFTDYLALSASGRRFTMVGNSDSHTSERAPGTPRSFVRVPNEASFSWADVAAGLRAGEVTVAASVFVTAELLGAAGDTATVRVRVQAPPWAPTETLRIFAGTESVVERPLPGSAALRFDETIDVPLGGANAVLVRVDGASAPRPMQHFPALGATNPIVIE